MKQHGDWILEGLERRIIEDPNLSDFYQERGRRTRGNLPFIMLVGKVGEMRAKELLPKAHFGSGDLEAGPALEEVVHLLDLTLLQLQRLCQAHREYPASVIAEKLKRGEYYEDAKDYTNAP